jgi:hypothetical protein
MTRLHRALAYLLLTGVPACGPGGPGDGDGSTSAALDAAEPLDLDAERARPASLIHNPRAFKPMARDAATPVVAPHDPTEVTHCLNGKHVVLGFSAYGGGYINFAHYSKNARAVDCDDVRKGRVHNEANAGFGRGWQSSLRDGLHTNRYNPTQAGFMDGAGRFVTGFAQSEQRYTGVGKVRRFETPSFMAPLFSDPVFDFTRFEELYPDFRAEPANVPADTDRIAAETAGGRDGQDQDAEIRSEFDFAGATEVWTNAVGVGDVDVFRHTFSYVYERAPGAIYQFGPDARNEDHERVLNDDARVAPVSAKFRGHNARNTDLSYLTLTFGIRFGLSEGFDTLVWVDERGRLRERQIGVDDARYQLENGGDVGKTDKYHRKYFGGKTEGIAKGNVAMLCKGCKGRGARRAWALYAPSTATNRSQTFGRSPRKTYAEDRRLTTIFKAERAGEGTGTTEVLGGRYESSLHSLALRTYTTGLFAPGRTGKDVKEGVRQEVFILHGDPDEILRTIRKLDGVLDRLAK